MKLTGNVSDDVRLLVKSNVIFEQLSKEREGSRAASLTTDLHRTTRYFDVGGINYMAMSSRSAGVNIFVDEKEDRREVVLDYDDEQDSTEESKTVEDGQSGH
ncbi:hypothetical protein NDU88_005358 [Pleurodeles waltl]|uniref:Uncharacterized protein n=1 Tax=Pleurodeles waltl TaxID=8319 RepID=A0AAV7TB35_PLEWA|nr:hypothetical protein NDU88_005358 [Pleurodeles waltl]